MIWRDFSYQAFVIGFLGRCLSNSVRPCAGKKECRLLSAGQYLYVDRSRRLNIISGKHSLKASVY
jgi:hypothetical protein